MRARLATLRPCLSLSSLLSGHIPTAGTTRRQTGLSMNLSPWPNEKDASYWKVMGMLAQGSLFALTGKAVEAVPMLTSGLTALRSTGAILHLPWYILSLARAYAGAWPIR